MIVDRGRLLSTLRDDAAKWSGSTYLMIEADPRAYMRIASLVRAEITDGSLQPGQPTPSITTLAQEHGVARQTAAKALRLLESEGLVYRVPGLGYFVK
jgi:DNA-binding GntR family transcriptional regulator